MTTGVPSGTFCIRYRRSSVGARRQRAVSAWPSPVGCINSSAVRKCLFTAGSYFRTPHGVIRDLPELARICTRLDFSADHSSLLPGLLSISRFTHPSTPSGDVANMDTTAFWLRWHEDDRLVSLTSARR